MSVLHAGNALNGLTGPSKPGVCAKHYWLALVWLFFLYMVRCSFLMLTPLGKYYAYIQLAYPLADTRMVVCLSSLLYNHVVWGSVPMCGHLGQVSSIIAIEKPMLCE